MAGMKASYLVGSLVVLVSACANLPAPSVPGQGRYLIMSVAGSPVAQIDAKDDANCQSMGVAVVKRSPNMTGQTRCDTKQADADLPYMAIVRNNQVMVDITSRYRTDTLCTRTVAIMINRGDTVVRNCTKTD